MPGQFSDSGFESADSDSDSNGELYDDDLCAVNGGLMSVNEICTWFPAYKPVLPGLASNDAHYDSSSSSDASFQNSWSDDDDGFSSEPQSTTSSSNSTNSSDIETDIECTDTEN